MIRNRDSQSSKHIPDYFTKVLQLYDAKVACFTELSQGTTVDEKNEFARQDLIAEMNRCIARFEHHPEEIEENLPKMNQFIFGGPYPVPVLTF